MSLAAILEQPQIVHRESNSHGGVASCSNAILEQPQIAHRESNPHGVVASCSHPHGVVAKRKAQQGMFATPPQTNISNLFKANQALANNGHPRPNSSA